MKKLIILIPLLLIGCTLSNTPTSKIEEFLGKYQSLNIEINTEKLNIDKENKKEIEEIIKRQYKNMSYEIKDEEIDGNKSVVTVEIEVYNYKDILNENNNVIKELKKTKKRITYTINFELTKEKDIWKINNLKEEDNNKLLGIF